MLPWLTNDPNQDEQTWRVVPSCAGPGGKNPVTRIDPARRGKATLASLSVRIMVGESLINAF
jgi:hypothetical protein